MSSRAVSSRLKGRHGPRGTPASRIKLEEWIILEAKSARTWGPDSTRVCATRAAPPPRPRPPGSARGPDRRKLDVRAAACSLRGAPSHSSATCRAPPAPGSPRDAPAPTAARSAQAPPRGSGRRERLWPRLETEAKAAAAREEEERRGRRRRRWRRGAHEAAAGGTGRGPAEEAAPGEPAIRWGAAARPAEEKRARGGARGEAGELAGRPARGRGGRAPAEGAPGRGGGAAEPGGASRPAPTAAPARPPPLSAGARLPNWEGTGSGAGWAAAAGRAGSRDPGRALGRRSQVLGRLGAQGRAGAAARHRGSRAALCLRRSAPGGSPGAARFVRRPSSVAAGTPASRARFREHCARGLGAGAGWAGMGHRLLIKTFPLLKMIFFHLVKLWTTVVFFNPSVSRFKIKRRR